MVSGSVCWLVWTGSPTRLPWDTAGAGKASGGGQCMSMCVCVCVFVFVHVFATFIDFLAPHLRHAIVAPGFSCTGV